MQTFLPYSDFTKSAKVLDMRRLGKQRIEAKQIYLALTRFDSGWKNHPAVKMWGDYLPALTSYGWVMCNEWKARGYKDTLAPWFGEMYVKCFHPCWKNPHWATEEFCRAHQSNLLRKNVGYYGRFFPGVPSDLPYIWPR